MKPRSSGRRFLLRATLTTGGVLVGAACGGSSTAVGSIFVPPSDAGPDAAYVSIGSPIGTAPFPPDASDDGSAVDGGDGDASVTTDGGDASPTDDAGDGG